MAWQNKITRIIRGVSRIGFSASASLPLLIDTQKYQNTRQHLHLFCQLLGPYANNMHYKIEEFQLISSNRVKIFYA